MQLPNKLYSYRNSTLALVPLVLRELQDGPLPVVTLFLRVKPGLKEATDFLSVMDCLYALRAINVSNEGVVSKCS
jgi:hypothetical protein